MFLKLNLQEYIFTNHLLYSTFILGAESCLLSTFWRQLEFGLIESKKGGKQTFVSINPMKKWLPIYGQIESRKHLEESVKHPEQHS